MSKTKPSGPAHYELMFIVSNRFTEDEAKQSIAKVEKLITDQEGQITKGDYWGKKRLAYPIKHDAYGYYQLLEFDLERSALAKVDERLRLDNEILRFIIVKKPLKSEEQIKKAKKISEKISSKKIEKEKEEEKQEKIKSQEAKGIKTKTDKSKVNIESLDEKLEGILNADDLI
jgi:small subunit ribosomal protein S6